MDDSLAACRSTPSSCQPHPNGLPLHTSGRQKLQTKRYLPLSLEPDGDGLVNDTVDPEDKSRCNSIH